MFHDVNLYVAEKRSNVTIKYANFCRKNLLAPLDLKLHVLNTCVSSTLIYGCESCGHSKFQAIDALHRQGLRTALSVRPTWNNEIVYVETGELPLEVTIVKQQLKFWNTLQTILNTPDHYTFFLYKQLDFQFEPGVANGFCEKKAESCLVLSCLVLYSIFARFSEN